MIKNRLYIILIVFLLSTVFFTGCPTDEDPTNGIQDCMPDGAIFDVGTSGIVYKLNPYTNSAGELVIPFYTPINDNDYHRQISLRMWDGTSWSTKNVAQIYGQKIPGIAYFNDKWHLFINGQIGETDDHQAIWVSQLGNGEFSAPQYIPSVPSLGSGANFSLYPAVNTVSQTLGMAINVYNSTYDGWIVYFAELNTSDVWNISNCYTNGLNVNAVCFATFYKNDGTPHVIYNEISSDQYSIARREGSSWTHQDNSPVSVQPNFYNGWATYRKTETKEEIIMVWGQLDSVLDMYGIVFDMNTESIGSAQSLLSDVGGNSIPSLYLGLNSDNTNGVVLAYQGNTNKAWIGSFEDGFFSTLSSYRLDLAFFTRPGYFEDACENGRILTQAGLAGSDITLDLVEISTYGE